MKVTEIIFENYPAQSAPTFVLENGNHMKPRFHMPTGEFMGWVETTPATVDPQEERKEI